MISNADDCDNDLTKENFNEFGIDYFLIYDQNYKVYFQRLK